MLGGAYMGTNVGDRSRVSSRINNVKHVYIHAVLRLTITLLVVGCSFVYCGTPVVVWAHEGHGADHAADDLVGTPVSKIERLTNDTKQKIQRETGQDPGADPQRRMNISGQESSAFAVSADPGISGKWSAVYGTQVVPVFQAVLPNGKVLIWDSVGDNPTESYPDQSFTRAMVWNPTNNTYRRVDLWGYNIFCAGFAHLPNGNILVAGGNKDTQLAGIVQIGRAHV